MRHHEFWDHFAGDGQGRKWSRWTCRYQGVSECLWFLEDITHIHPLRGIFNGESRERDDSQYGEYESQKHLTLHDWDTLNNLKA